jgi:GTP-binding protein
MGELLDELIKYNPVNYSDNEKHISFCIIGRTNVGKSTLMNSILNQDRVVVSEKEHTTRDAVDEDFYYKKELYTIIDTAGIRRKGHIKTQAEKFAVERTNQAIGRSDMILFVIDGDNGFNEQDEVIGGLAYKANVPTIIVVNK